MLCDSPALLDNIVGPYRGSAAGMRFRALFGMVGKQLPGTGHRQHGGLQMRVGKLLGHRETIGGDIWPVGSFVIRGL
jgi:hypothetical protein